MPKGTYDKRGKIASGTGLIYVKSPGGALRKNASEKRKAQKDLADSNTRFQKIARKYVGSENVKGDSAKRRIASADASSREVRKYVKKTRNK